MDIIDIMLARAMTPQGQTEIYVAKADKAAATAEKAKADAVAAVNTLEEAADEVAVARTEAQSLLEEARETLETAQAAQINTLDVEDVDDEIKKLNISIKNTDTQNHKLLQMETKYPDNTTHTENITKLYKSEGNNEDGTMTQKAIKTYVDSKSNSATVNFDPNNAGHIVIIDKDGKIISGTTTEEQIINALIAAGIDPSTNNEIGLDIDYQNKVFARLQKASNLTMGQDFNKFVMYGGRKRCNVSDNGTITAFYGDSNYREDGSNGQVMVYQPKFYYQRTPLKLNDKTVRRETLTISSTKKPGFKLHPLFDAGNNEEYEYVLLSAYEGTINNNILSSITGAQPVSNVTVADAEMYARARGEGWHIMNMAAVSANQMLEIVEFGQMNGQNALEAGITNLNYTSNKNCSAIIGSTSVLGNSSGHATTTISNNNGVELTNTEAGKRAISYRGMENPWGNIWNMIGGINIKGDGYSQGGAPYICNDFNYTPSLINSNYEYIGFNLPSTYGWINGMGYGEEKYDWVYLPAECASGANSLLPVGDNLWTVGNVSENKIIAVGGTYGFGEADGPFYYACDSSANNSNKHNYSARLMFIPTKNAIYENNILKWTNVMGG